MMITPQARRRITGAVQALPDANSRDRWGKWAEAEASDRLRTDVPYDIAEIALRALSTAERKIEELLSGAVALDEDLQADLLNDLGYLQAVEMALRNEGLGR